MNGGAGLSSAAESRGGAVSPASTVWCWGLESAAPGSQGRWSIGVAVMARRAAEARSQNETPSLAGLLGPVRLLANLGAGWGRNRPPGTAPGAPGVAGFGVAWMVLVVEADPRRSRAAGGLRREAGVWRWRLGGDWEDSGVSSPASDPRGSCGPARSSVSLKGGKASPPSERGRFRFGPTGSRWAGSLGARASRAPGECGSRPGTLFVMPTAWTSHIKCCRLLPAER